MCVCARYLEEGLFLLQVLADHGADVVGFTVGPEFVRSSAPVLLTLVLLLQTLQNTTYLQHRQEDEPSTACWPFKIITI